MLRPGLYFFFTNSAKPLKQILTGQNPFSSINFRFSFCTICNKDTDGGAIQKQKTKHESFRHNYHEEVEGAVNKQILTEFNASMVYLSMSCYYGRTDISMPGCQAYFKKMYHEEQGHAMDFINYQLMRGAQVKLYPITVPENSDWTDITVSLGVALELEKNVKEQLEALALLAEEHEDAQLVDIVTSKYMEEQNESICEMGRMLTRAKRLVDCGGVGRHLFDLIVFKYVKEKSSEFAPPHYV